MHRELLLLLLGFEWDIGNASKNEDRHQVSRPEAEEVFVGDGLILLPDATHSAKEARYFAFGATQRGRALTIAFTVRGHRVRIIMARDMSRKERVWYEKEAKKDSSF